MSQLPKKKTKGSKKVTQSCVDYNSHAIEKFGKNMIDCTKVEGLVGKLYLKCTY